MKKPIFILALFCIPLIAAAQSGYSMDTAKVNALLQQSIDVEGDTVFTLLQTAQNLAQGAGYTTGEARALMYEGIELEEIHDYPRAVSLYQQALTLYAGLRDSLGIAKCYANLGAAFYRQGENEKGVEYWNLARPLFQRHGQNSNLIVLLNNILSAYTIMGKPEKALLLADTALAIAVQLADTLYQAMILNNLGMACERLERWEQAETIYRKSLAMFNALDDSYNYCRTLSNIGDVLNKTGRSPEAWALMTADSAHCLGFDEPSENTVLFYRALSDAAKGIGEYKTALEYHFLMKAMDDSVYTVERSERIRNVEAKYQNELIRKEKTIQQTQLHNQRIALWSVAGALLLIALLAMSIWRGKRRSDGLLANILPLNTIRELKRTGSVKARRFESASVLFTDFKGFTQISEQLTPEQLVHEIDRCFKAFDAIIDRHAVEKIKTIGDSYMCACGLPVPNEKHAHALVGAALEMQVFMHEYNLERNKQGLPELPMRIGIHSGPVVAGVVGTRKFTYDIWGDTVNTAARLESVGEPGQVNISSATQALVKDTFRCTSRGNIAAKGKGAMEMYFVEK